MNQRVPDSSGLPLRAMVMVLLFLGVIFLLAGFFGFQAILSGGNSDDSNSPVSTVKTSTTARRPTPAAKSDVRVYNISVPRQVGVATRTADRLKAGGFNVTEVDDLSLPDVTLTTVYFGNPPGEHDTADAVGKLLNAPVEPRIPEVADQPPGVIVVVAG